MMGHTKEVSKRCYEDSRKELKEYIVKHGADGSPKHIELSERTKALANLVIIRARYFLN